MTTEEWNKLHGYDAAGEPTQNLAWEGPGHGPPGRYVERSNHFHLWYVLTSNHIQPRRSRIFAVAKYEDGKWAITGPDDDDWFREMFTSDIPYADAIRQLTVILALRGG